MLELSWNPPPWYSWSIFFQQVSSLSCLIPLRVPVTEEEEGDRVRKEGTLKGGEAGLPMLGTEEGVDRLSIKLMSAKEGTPLTF